MIVGIERDDGGLSVMTLVEHIQTVKEIEHEIERWESGGAWKCVRWEALADYPPRENRSAYELGSFSVALNEAKIVAPEPDTKQVLVDLEDRLTALEAKS